MSDREILQKVFQCGRIFNPAAPINDYDLFRGRVQQLDRVVSAIATRGQHVVLFGDRGVGKTSLANILKTALQQEASLEFIFVNCSKTDTYLSVWKNALAAIPILIEEPGEQDLPRQVEYGLDQFLISPESMSSGELKRLLCRKCAEDHELVIIFDEFDRMGIEHRRAFADTIKDLSDSSVNATIILIGVAQSATGLIEEHKSIERCIAQVYMPPMADYELRQIIEKGLAKLDLKIDRENTDIIVTLSRGYPYYTHLLCYHAAVRAVKLASPFIATADLAHSIKESLEKAQASVKDEYLKAAQGQRRGTKYPVLVLACALASTDEMGYFRPVDVKTIENDKVIASNIVQDCSEQLNKLATDENRGYVLERVGSPRKYKYRFHNPLLRPYILMKGIADKIIDSTLMDQLCGATEKTKSFSSGLYDSFPDPV